MNLNDLIESASGILFGICIFIAIYNIIVYYWVRSSSSMTDNLSRVKDKFYNEYIKGLSARKEVSVLENKKYQLVMLLSTITFIIMSIGSGKEYIAGCFGFIIGLAVSYIMEYVYNKNDRLEKMREVVQLYEMIDMLTSHPSNYKLYDALQRCESLFPKLRKAIRKCLNMWPNGSIRALDAMGEEINLPEVNVLITILKSAEEVGQERFSGALKDEALRIDEYRQKVIELSMENKPAIQSLFSALLLGIFLAMILGPGYTFVTSILLNMKGGF